MYTPKRLKWNSLSDFRDHLLRETKEKVLEFTGYSITTQTAIYRLAHGTLDIEPRTKRAKKT